MFQASGLVTESIFPSLDFPTGTSKAKLQSPSVPAFMGISEKSWEAETSRWSDSSPKVETSQRKKLISEANLYRTSTIYLWLVSLLAIGAPLARFLHQTFVLIIFACWCNVVMLWFLHNEGLVCASLALGFGSPLEPCQHRDDMCLACLVCLVCTVCGIHMYALWSKDVWMDMSAGRAKVTKWYKFIGSSCQLTDHRHWKPGIATAAPVENSIGVSVTWLHRLNLCDIESVQCVQSKVNGAASSVRRAHRSNSPLFFGKSVADGDAFTWPSQHASQSHVSTF